MAEYAISKTLDCTYDEAVEKTRAELAKEGFGILTEIDVKATLKKKLDEDFRNYIILGACNPPFALRAFNLETEIGLFLPCNVIVYENDDKSVVVSAVDPLAMMSMIDTPGLDELATEVRVVLERVIAAL
ncbi:MAG: DUF302 domain-containing protein [Proteobacteria bacterium]|nr:DUF302 domain-containing protein [Pseudomonadota bacterium]